MPWLLYPGERAPSIHWIGGQISPRPGLDTVKTKIPVYAGNSILAIQLIA